MSSGFEERTLDQLVIEDEKSFRHVGLYTDLKNVLLRSGYKFRILRQTNKTNALRWDRALFLNLTFWSNGGGDVLVDDHIPADVVAHVAWHYLASRPKAAGATKPNQLLSADALFFGEAIASAFDLYLIGRLLGHAPNSTFLETQVSALSLSASEAGMNEDDLSALLETISADPDRAFEDLRELLFDATTSLVACNSVDEAHDVLTRFESHRFAALLHHYELSNWSLYARAYARDALAPDPLIREADRILREAPVALDWLTKEWVDACNT